MKRTFITSLLCGAAALIAPARQYLAPAAFDNNWSAGLNGGVTTPLAHGHAFFGDMRATIGAHVQKQISPAFGMGIEGQFGINTSSWYGRQRQSTAFDNSYVGVYGAVNLMNLFGGFNCGVRPFDIEIIGGAGWGHEYTNNGPNKTRNLPDANYFATRAGLSLNYNINHRVTLSLQPSVIWNMTGSPYTEALDIDQTSAGYRRGLATFNCRLGVAYHFGPRFSCVVPGSGDDIEALNEEINRLRADIEACTATTAAAGAAAAELAAQLEACRNRKPQVIKEINNNFQSVRYIFYKVGSSVITPDQMPNVEMVASYLRNHKDATVVVKGYASPEGNPELNIKLAAARAESVKNALINKYGVKAERIKAEGEGIGHMFTENDWNRVSICTLD